MRRCRLSDRVRFALVAVQYATMSLGQVSKFVTLTNRYLPRINRYWAFVTRRPAATERGLERDPVSGGRARPGSEATPATS